MNNNVVIRLLINGKKNMVVKAEELPKYWRVFKYAHFSL